MISLVYFATHGETISPLAWIQAALVLGVWSILKFYAFWRCSVPEFSSRDGLATGVPYSVLFVVVSALFVTFIGSVSIALSKNLRLRQQVTPVQFQNLVRRFHQYRLHK